MLFAVQPQSDTHWNRDDRPVACRRIEALPGPVFEVLIATDAGDEDLRTLIEAIDVDRYLARRGLPVAGLSAEAAPGSAPPPRP